MRLYRKFTFFIVYCLWPRITRRPMCYMTMGIAIADPDKTIRIKVEENEEVKENGQRKERTVVC